MTTADDIMKQIKDNDAMVKQFKERYEQLLKKDTDVILDRSSKPKPAPATGKGGKP